MSEFRDERIEPVPDKNKKIIQEPIETREESAPAFTSRLEKYHSTKSKNKKNRPSSDSEPRKISTDPGIEIKSGSKPDEEAVHKRSSKDADLNIKKLIDLDEGADTNQSAPKPQKKLSKTAKAWLIALLCVGIAICFVLIFVVEVVYIEGQSMEPTLYGGEKIIAEKISRYFEFPSKGQVVVTTYDGYEGYYVKRLIALPGEWVEIYDNTVYVNGEALQEDYINPEVKYEDMALTQVPEGCVFLMGDNRAQSLDSRMDSIGPVKAENLVGNAWCVILPFENIRTIN